MLKSSLKRAFKATLKQNCRFDASKGEDGNQQPRGAAAATASRNQGTVINTFACMGTTGLTTMRSRAVSGDLSAPHHVWILSAGNWPPLTDCTVKHR